MRLALLLLGAVLGVGMSYSLLLSFALIVLAIRNPQVSAPIEGNFPHSVRRRR